MDPPSSPIAARPPRTTARIGMRTSIMPDTDDTIVASSPSTNKATTTALLKEVVDLSGDGGSASGGETGTNGGGGALQGLFRQEGERKDTMQLRKEPLRRTYRSKKSLKESFGWRFGSHNKRSKGGLKNSSDNIIQTPNSTNGETT